MKRSHYVTLVSLIAGSVSACYVGAANRPLNAPSSGTSERPAPGIARFVSLNVVHGTAMPIPPFLVRESTVETNLSRIGALLRDQSPTIVALQETDHGRRNNRTELLAKLGSFPYWADDSSVAHGSLRHGASLLAAVPLQEASSNTLVKGITGDKGWVSAVVSVEAWGGQRVRVVSLHLDPFSASARERQVDQLVRGLENEPLPVVLMGDFNCGWEHGRCAQRLANRLGLSAAPTHSTPTYSFLGIRKNLDWILVSPQLEVKSVRVLPVRVSDHRPVVAEIALKDSPSLRR